MMERCIGITDDLSDMEDMMRLPTWQRIGFRVYFPLGCDIVCESRDDLDLVLEGYEPIGDYEKYPKAKLFQIKLFRKKGRVLLWAGAASNANVQGPPRLKWAKQ
jgi:hypothetical protein